jgi:sulfate transport system substrate-binding protein
MSCRLARAALTAAAFAVLGLLGDSASAVERQLTNASYDVTREFYTDFNQAFAAHWRAKTGDAVEIHQSHGGSSKQARAVIDGLDADVVTMNQAADIDAIAEKSGRLAKDWAARLPNASVPFTSTIVFVVRKGNPKAIQGWGDLVRPGVGVIVPNPKTSGNGRYSYLAAWGWAAREKGGEDGARAFVQQLFANVPVLDAGGRGATTSFAERGLGDVLLTFENEVALLQAEFGSDGFEAVYPSTSIRADLPVAWVDDVVAKHGTQDLARAYLEYLYSPEGQEIGARRGYRPTASDVALRYAARFPKLELLSVQDVAGSWSGAQKKHFADGGTFDQIYALR